MPALPEKRHELGQQPARDLTGLGVLMDLIEDDERPGLHGRVFPHNVQKKVQQLDLPEREDGRPLEVLVLPEVVEDEDLAAPLRRLSDCLFY